MKPWMLLTIGAVCVLVGGVWTLQGVGVIGGSFMTSSPTWLAIGAVVLVAGLTMIMIAVRSTRSTRRTPGDR